VPALWAGAAVVGAGVVAAMLLPGRVGARSEAAEPAADAEPVPA